MWVEMWDEDPKTGKILCDNNLLSHWSGGRGVRSKVWVAESGWRIGGNVLLRGALYCLLRNRTYLGEISHKGNVYPGEHLAIVDRNTWNEVQARLGDNGRQPRGTTHSRSDALLAGLLHDDSGNLMSPSFARKANGQRYRYYISRALVDDRKKRGLVQRVPATVVERTVIEQLARHVGSLPTGDAAVRALLRDRVTRIQILPDKMLLDFRAPPQGPRRQQPKGKQVVVPLTTKTAGAMVVLHDETPRAGVNATLIRSLVRALEWRRQIEEGHVASPEELARKHGCNRTHARAMLGLAFLAPDLVERCLSGSPPSKLITRRLLARGVPLSWQQQRRTF